MHVRSSMDVVEVVVVDVVMMVGVLVVVVSVVLVLVVVVSVVLVLFGPRGAPKSSRPLREIEEFDGAPWLRPMCMQSRRSTKLTKARAIFDLRSICQAQ